MPAPAYLAFIRAYLDPFAPLVSALALPLDAQLAFVCLCVAARHTLLTVTVRRSYVRWNHTPISLSLANTAAFLARANDVLAVVLDSPVTLPSIAALAPDAM